ncbi:DNA polymerase IV [Clostridiaceae bacterium M8S5]|nr:DNA polymerase IV [Clostridiaceae bacterium M8S5]
MMKKIIHVDMDAFYAAIEQHDNDLRGKAVIVGGIKGRGVVSTCSYEARKYGVHSAMPTFIARKKCPDAIFMPVRMSRYKEVSKKVFRILRSITTSIEPLSIDEAYLDVSNSEDDPINIVKTIKREVLRETGLTLSAGISYNKFLAKVASDWNKPNGIKIIKEEDMPNILFPLSIKKVYGLGKKSVEMFNKFGVFTIEDLYGLSKEYLIEVLGKHGEDIYNRIRGKDTRIVSRTTSSKSIGRETTLIEDTTNKDIFKKIIKDYSLQLEQSLIKDKSHAKTVTIKYKTSDFNSHTKSKTMPYYLQNKDEIYQIACDIIDNIYFMKPVRLIGLTVSHIEDSSVRQITIFDLMNN